MSSPIVLFQSLQDETMNANAGGIKQNAERMFEEAMAWLTSRFAPHHVDDAFREKVREDCYLAAENGVTTWWYTKHTSPELSAARAEHEAAQKTLAIAAPITTFPPPDQPARPLHPSLLANAPAASRRIGTHTIKRPSNAEYAIMNRSVWAALASRQHQQVVDVAAIQAEVKAGLGRNMREYYEEYEALVGERKGCRKSVLKTIWKMKRQGYLTGENKFTESGRVKLEALGLGDETE